MVNFIINKVFIKVIIFIKLFIVTISAFGQNEQFYISVPLSEQNLKGANQQKIQTISDTNTVYFFNGEDNNNTLRAGRPNGPKQSIEAWQPDTFERKIILNSNKLPGTSRFITIHNSWVYYLFQKGSKWIINRVNFNNPEIIEEIGAEQMGVPLTIASSRSGTDIFVVVKDGIYKISSLNLYTTTFLKLNIFQVNSASNFIDSSIDDKQIILGSGMGWLYLLKNDESGLKIIGLHDFTAGLSEPPTLNNSTNIKEYNERSKIWADIQITAIGFFHNDIVVGTYGGKILILNSKTSNLKILSEVNVDGRFENNFGRIGGFFSWNSDLFFSLEGGGVNIMNIPKTDENQKFSKQKIQQIPLNVIGSQLGEVFDISLVSNGTYSILGKTREVARIECCTNVSLIARDTPMPDGGRATIIKEGYFDLHTSIIKNFDSINYHYGSKFGSVLEVFDVLNRPDIVKAKLRGEDIRPLIGDLTLDKALQTPPPKITITKTVVDTNSKRLKIPYTITPDNGGIAEVRIFHNGKLISSDGTYKDAPGKAYAPVGGKNADANQYAEAQRSVRNAGLLEPANSAAANQAASLRNQLIVRGAPEKKCNPCKGEIEIDVIPGEENTVSVVAFNRDNTIQSVPASVTFKSTLPKEEPHLWLLSVGINQFQGITPLVNAKKDALDFACTYAGKAALTKLGLDCSEAGRAQSLFKPQNIHVVDALLDAKATKANIQGALDKIASQAKPGDTFVWFVASHGMMDANSLFGIVAHDTKCLNDKCTDISGQITSNEILEASKKIKAMKQLMVLDTCHSGGLDSKMSGLYDARMSLLAKNMGLHMYASAQATEQAQDGVPGANGTFTAQLLEGIKGAAPKNSEGLISVMTLGQYAKQKTIEATQSKGGANAGKAVQTPVIQHFGLDAGLVGVGAR